MINYNHFSGRVEDSLENALHTSRICHEVEEELDGEDGPGDLSANNFQKKNSLDAVVWIRQPVGD